MKEHFNLFDHSVGSIERQEVPAILNRHHLGAWKQAPIALAPAGSGPILVATDKTHENADLWMALGLFFFASDS
jgi:hypothetical protein